MFSNLQWKLLCLAAFFSWVCAYKHPYEFEKPNYVKYGIVNTFQSRRGHFAPQEQERSRPWIGDAETGSYKKRNNNLRAILNQTKAMPTLIPKKPTEYYDYDYDDYDSHEKHALLSKRVPVLAMPRMDQRSMHKHRLPPQKYPLVKKSGFDERSRLRSKQGHVEEDAIASEAKTRVTDEYYYDDYSYEDFYSNEKKTSTKKRKQKYDRDDGYGDDADALNPLALLVAPLAGIALLAAAAAVALNPVLVSISVTNGRKRRKRNGDENRIGQSGYFTPEIEEKLAEMQVLEEFLGKDPSHEDYQQKMLAMYLRCSGFEDEKNFCLDRVVCEYSNGNSQLSKQEKDVISIILYQIMANPNIEESYKERLRTSAKIGKENKEEICPKMYPCFQLDAMMSK